MEPTDAKRELRGPARARRIALGPDERARASALIVDAVAALPQWRSARTVAIYEPAGTEVDVWTLAAEAATRGCAVVVPEVFDDEVGVPGGSGRMRFVPVAEGSSAGGDVRDAVPELVPDLVPDVVVVPLLAFDRTGNRLGQGGGYYDRWLAASPALRVGVAFACQELPEVPVDAHDVPLDLVVTEDAVLRTGRRA